MQDGATATEEKVVDAVLDLEDEQACDGRVGWSHDALRHRGLLGEHPAVLAWCAPTSERHDELAVFWTRWPSVTAMRILEVDADERFWQCSTA